MLMLQYKVLLLMTDLVVVFVLFTFMLVLLYFCVATVSRRMKIYIIGRGMHPIFTASPGDRGSI